VSVVVPIPVSTVSTGSVVPPVVEPVPVSVSVSAPLPPGSVVVVVAVSMAVSVPVSVPVVATPSTPSQLVSRASPYGSGAPGFTEPRVSSQSPVHGL